MGFASLLAADAEKGQPTIFRQTFGADDTRKQTAIGQILLDCAKRFLAGQKHRAQAHGRIFGTDRSRILHIDFEDDTGLIELGRSREVTERDKQAGQNAQGHNPELLQDGVPEVAEVEAAMLRGRFDRDARGGGKNLAGHDRRRRGSGGLMGRGKHVEV